MRDSRFLTHTLVNTSKKLFVEDDKQFKSFRYDPNKEQWVPGGTELFDNRIGFDASEPEDSPYRYGSYLV